MNTLAEIMKIIVPVVIFGLAALAYWYEQKKKRQKQEKDKN